MLLNARDACLPSRAVPAAGESGQLGREEVEWLTPWLDQQRQQRPDVVLDGPLPPDTMWLPAARAWWGHPSRPAAGGRQAAPAAALQAQAPAGLQAQAPADAFLALYHDQGLIAVKLLAFDSAVNTSIGLPFVRTSPDHGTAFGIAGQGVADASSMKAAIRLGAQLAGQRAAGGGALV